MNQLRFSVLGSIIIISLNLFSFYYMRQESAVPFQGEWWSRWFPIYTVWVVYALLGFVLRLRNRKRK